LSPMYKVRQFCAWVFRPEKMPADEDSPSLQNSNAGFLAWLFSPEPMPQNPEPAPTEPNPGYLTWLFSPEPLPDETDRLAPNSEQTQSPEVPRGSE